ncbi:hypothetical protein [Halosimplex halobium]|uniref:hypothetical protein n=1 Tax=Halosimplex halobium TaxID=3396618 RepID=UPI003F57C408
MTDYVPVYDEDGNLKHYQTTDPEFSSVEAKDAFTDPGGKVHTGVIGGGGGGISLVGRYSSNTTHTGDYNGVVMFSGSVLTLDSTGVSDGDYLVVANFGGNDANLEDAASAEFQRIGFTIDPASGGYIQVATGALAWVTWNDSEGYWEVAGNCSFSP